LPDNIFPIFYLIGLIVYSAIRVWYEMKYWQDRKSIFRTEGFITGLLIYLAPLAMLMPLLYMFTSWLDFANYDLPTWTGWVGTAIFALGLWLLWRSHADLGHNWSITTEIKKEQTLTTNGVFKYIRHPMYAAYWLWGIAQALLIQNWIAGLTYLAFFIPLYLLRVPREERMMLEQFGEEYRLYINRTGRIIPRPRR
jgi:protein-S-isoprenylcysteine O-methyltransferase Ste14